MLEEQATVVAIENDAVWVEVHRQTACGQCAANKGCGTAVLQKVLGNKRNIFRVIGDLPVTVGDEVIIGVNENAIVKGSLIIYALPIIFMIIFAGVGETIALQSWSMSSEYMSVIGALFGLVVSIAGLRIFNRKISHSSQYQAVVLRHADNKITGTKPEYKLLG